MNREPGARRPDASHTRQRCSTRSKGTVSSSRPMRSEEHTSELQSRQYLVCRLLLEKKISDTMSFPSLASISFSSASQPLFPALAAPPLLPSLSRLLCDHQPPSASVHSPVSHLASCL